MQDSTPKIYLDNNATTPLDPRVYECMHAAFLTHFGNPASVQHAWGWAAEELVNIAREELAGALGCKPQEIVFTSGATESINLALRGILERDGGRLIQSTVEHKAGVDVGKYLASLGCEVLEVGVDRYGMVDLDPVSYTHLTLPTSFVV